MDKKIIFLIMIITIMSNIFAFSNLTQNESINSTTIKLTNITNLTSKIIDINPYKNNKIKNIKFKDIIYESKNGIDKKVKVKSKKDKVYSLIQFNKNPSKDELKQLKSEGIILLDYISSNTWYASINQKLSNIVEENKDKDLKLRNNKFNDKYIIKNIGEIKSDYKLSKNLKNNKIKTS